MFNKWIDRFNNELELQKQLGTEMISMRFTRKEVIELRVCMNTLKELDDMEKNDEPEGFCEWKRKSNLHAYSSYTQQCNGHKHEIEMNDGAIRRFRFCPYCSKKIKVV